MSISEANKEFIALLKAQRPAVWYKRLFYPRALYNALEQYNSEFPTPDAVLEVCQACLTHTWFFQRWFFTSIAHFFNSPLMSMFRMWKSDDLSEEVIKRRLDVVIQVEHPENTDSVEVVGSQIASFLSFMHQENWSKEQISYFESRATSELCQAMDILHKANLLTEYNFDELLRSDDAYSKLRLSTLTEFLSIAQKANLLSQDILTSLISVRGSSTPLLTEGIKILQRSSLLEGEFAKGNLEKFSKLNGLSLLKVIRAINFLAEERMLTPNNFKNLIECLSPRIFCELLLRIRPGILSAEGGQNLFDGLCTHSAFLSSRVIENIFAEIPYDLLSAAHVQHLIEIAVLYRNTPQEAHLALRELRDRILFQEVIEEPNQGFNPRQSTHTASVHRSASESATKLKQRYGEQLSGDNLDKVLKNILEWLKGIAEESPQIVAAKRCLPQILEEYTYEDPNSEVSTHQLVALIWIAIHDNSLCQGLDNAKKMFLQGLYDIQRGYNLSESFIDNGEARDRRICTAGTFNKLIEAMHAQHPDIVLLVITKNGAIEKFKRLVNEEVYNYLKKLADSRGAEQQQMIASLLENETSESIWPIINKNIAETIFEEFGTELYKNNKKNEDFQALLELGTAVSLDKKIIDLLTSMKKPKATSAILADDAHRFFTHDARTSPVQEEINPQNQITELN